MAKSARKVGRARTRSGDIGAQGPRTTAEARTIRSVGESQIPSDALELTDKDLSVIRVGNRVLRGRPSKAGNRKLDILPDMPDVRDRIYTPNLRALEPAIYPRIAFSILDQGQELELHGIFTCACDRFPSLSGSWA